MVKCMICGESFEPSPSYLKQWAESCKGYDPTDWECPSCDWLMSQQTEELQNKSDYEIPF